MANMVLISSGKKPVCWMVNNNQPKVYDWHDSNIDTNTNTIIYNLGKHRAGINTIKNGTKGYYIEKKKGFWHLIGMITDIIDIDDYNCKLVIDTNNKHVGKLDTDKQRSMNSIGYTKPKGRNTGHWAWGFTLLTPINPEV